MGPSSLGIFARSDQNRDRANIGLIVMPFSRQAASTTSAFHDFPGITVSVYELRAASRGTIRLNSARADDPPAIRCNYLDAEEDRQVAIDGIRVARRLMRQGALAPHKPREIAPRPDVRDDDDSGLIDMFRSFATTVFHPVGTAKMGLPSDPMAVVDARLRMLGMSGLRVIDASVMPVITSGNTNAPTMMIAEKGAAMIVEDARG
jgi:choline dehydrogenase-like flavoprotein